MDPNGAYFTFLHFYIQNQKAKLHLQIVIPSHIP